MSKKPLPHLVFWPGLILIIVLCTLFVPKSLHRGYILGLICIWTGLTGFLKLCPIPLTGRYADDFDRTPFYPLFILLGILEIRFQFRTGIYLLLTAAVSVVIQLFDKE